MSQFLKVDVNYANHPKVLAAGEKLAMRNLAAMGWSATMGTDGHIPPQALPMLRMTEKDAERLVAHGLWERNGCGWDIHDYTEWQMTKQQRADLRAKWRERQDASRRAKRGRDNA